MKQESDIKREGYLQERHHFFHLRDTAGQERDFHFHEFDKIVILLSGKVDYAVENEIYTLMPRDILMIRHHTIHKAIIDKSVPYNRIIIYLDEKYYSSVFPESDLTICFEHADKSGKRRISIPEERRTDIFSLLEKYETVSFGSESSVKAMKETYIIQLLILLSEETDVHPESLSLKHGSKIEETLSYINEHLGSELSVEQLSSRLFLSKSHFMRLFSEATGTTVHSYILQRRLLNASRLIREGTDAAEAARLNGFDDYSSFYRAFKKNLGVSPRNIKK
ncbi:MAG: AraC family transcriptional regulator [Eubacteriales bacterium]|nr:AraC family transcriptional regulator [Eubacteriales bacterium]